jgi:hypothetical protein
MQIPRMASRSGRRLLSTRDLLWEECCHQEFVDAVHEGRDGNGEEEGEYHDDEKGRVWGKTKKLPSFVEGNSVSYKFDMKKIERKRNGTEVGQYFAYVPESMSYLDFR